MPDLRMSRLLNTLIVVVVRIVVVIAPRRGVFLD